MTVELDSRGGTNLRASTCSTQLQLANSIRASELYRLSHRHESPTEGPMKKFLNQLEHRKHSTKPAERKQSTQPNSLKDTVQHGLQTQLANGRVQKTERDGPRLATIELVTIANRHS